MLSIKTSATEYSIQRSAPEPGQLVEVRKRQWIVAKIDGGDSASSDSSKCNLVTLTSISEDSLGEEINVIWEIEPGAQIIEKSGLPNMSGLDSPLELRAFLDAVQWGTATNTERDLLQSPFRSGISIEDYQLDPLVRALDMARTNLLIADDVGLGKTIEAGLIVQELLLRHRARTVIVICPASLQEKWRLEMMEKFGLEFKIVNTNYIRQLRRKQGINANPWSSFPRLITSMDWVKQGEGLRLLRDIIPAQVTHPRKFDMLIIDEAHNISPSVGHYAVETHRTKLVRLIAKHFQHKLFLTATPHDGYTSSFTALLELLDDQRFARNVLPDRNQLARVMVRRLKSDIVDLDGQNVYPKRILKALKINYTDEERDAQNLLRNYIKHRESNDSENSQSINTFIHQLLRKRLASSPVAFASTLEKHILTVQGRSISRKTNKKLEDRILRRAIEKTKENYADDDSRDKSEAEALELATRQISPLTEIEQKILNDLQGWARKAANKSDSKALAVLSWLNDNLKEDNKWNDKRVILFTEYRDTQNWLHKILLSNEIEPNRIKLMYGGMETENREAVKAAFQANPRDSEVRILLATDAASEGIDLQNFCDMMIHLEIPYNPNVMEQRNGRIDRHGQRSSEVVIWHPVDAAGQQGEYILRAIKKLDTMREDMGSVNQIIAPQLPELLEGKRQELDSRIAETRIDTVRRFLKIERDYRDRVTRLHERLDETRKIQGLEPERIQQVVNTALKLAKRPDLKPKSIKDAPDGTVFEMPQLSGSWSKCLEGLEHPFNKKIRPITFNHEVAKNRDDIVLAHLNHPLVQMSLRLLRAEIWANEPEKKLSRVTAFSHPKATIESPIIIVKSRLMITGGNHFRLHEEITETGGYLSKHSFKREGITEVRKMLAESLESTDPNEFFSELKTRFDMQSESIFSAVMARSRERLRNLENTINRRKQKEIEDISTVLDELEIALKSELAKKMDPVQLPLFNEFERTQLMRDYEALEHRLKTIPDDRQKEIDLIEERYSNINVHTFPIAIILLIPILQ